MFLFVFVLCFISLLLLYFSSSSFVLLVWFSAIHHGCACVCVSFAIVFVTKLSPFFIVDYGFWLQNEIIEMKKKQQLLRASMIVAIISIKYQIEFNLKICVEQCAVRLCVRSVLQQYHLYASCERRRWRPILEPTNLCVYLGCVSNHTNIHARSEEERK